MKKNIRLLLQRKKKVFISLVVMLFTWGLVFMPGLADAAKTKAGVVKKISKKQQPTVSKYAKVYKGDGIKITTVRFGPKADAKVLILFEEVDHKWDGKILLHRVAESQTKTEMITTYNKKNWTTVYFPSGFSWYQGWKGYAEIYLPGYENVISVICDAKESKKVNTQKLLQRYLGKKSSAAKKSKKGKK
ncbi:hypothetical protein KAR34_08205 [bacterium]|nr:hypothetical protein [bacterium]